VTDARYWHQAERELDLSLWGIVQAASPDGPKDWIEWLMVSLLKGLRERSIKIYVGQGQGGKDRDRCSDAVSREISRHQCENKLTRFQDGLSASEPY
jgi:hypothetical protein